MKKIFLFLILIALISNPEFTENCFAQEKAPYKAVFQKEYKYESVPNDPTNARIYTLDNGLKVYMSIYKNAPRIQSYIAVRAGSKNDPADATGLAHYLEH